MRWKEELAGRHIITTPVTVMDVMPTVLELLNHSADAFYSDGKSLLPALFKMPQESEHKYIFHYIEVTKPAAITSGPYKVVYTEIKGKYQVFEMEVFVFGSQCLLRLQMAINQRGENSVHNLQ